MTPPSKYFSHLPSGTILSQKTAGAVTAIPRGREVAFHSIPQKEVPLYIYIQLLFYYYFLFYNLVWSTLFGADVLYLAGVTWFAYRILCPSLPLTVPNNLALGISMVGIAEAMLLGTIWRVWRWPTFFFFCLILFRNLILYLRGSYKKTTT